MATTIAELIATLGLDASDFDETLDKSEKKSKGFGDTMAGLSTIGGGILATGLTAAAGAATLLGVEIAKDVGIAADAQKVQAQLEAVLKSTGGVAGITAEKANELATSLSQVTAFDDEAIVSGESMLLTFTNIGEDVFPTATQTMLDMSQALGQDLKSSAMQLGKAINNPIEGVTALTRVGVTFSDQQKEQIKTMQESGDLMGAQTVILDELQKEFGGSAEAAGSTFAGQMTILNNSIDNIRENIGGKFLPILAQAGQMLSEELNKPEVLAFIDQFATSIAAFVQTAIQNIPAFIAGLKTAFQWLSDNKPVVIGILAALGVAVIAFGITTATAAATALVPLLPIIGIMLAIGVAVGVLAAAWANNWGGIREKTAAVVDFVKKGIQGWVQFFTITIPNAINFLKGIWTGAFQGITDAIAGVIDFVIKLKDNLVDILLPDWLTPGSPTPFELGLLGIADALKTVNDIGFAPAMADNMVLPKAGASASRQGQDTTKEVNYNIEINNPKGESSEESTRKSLKKLSYLGVAQ